MSAGDISVLLVDDHDVVRAGFRRLLDGAAGVQVCMEVENGERAYTEYMKLKPDVTIMDLSMPGIGGLEAIRRIRVKDGNARILALSMHEDSIFVKRVLQAGALGYVTKRCGPSVLIDALKIVAGGHSYLEHNIAQIMAVNSLSENDDPFSELSEREFEVLRMLVQGSSLGVISKKLFLSPKTISTYQTRLFCKLGTPNIVSLTRFAIRKGLIEP